MALIAKTSFPVNVFIIIRTEIDIIEWMRHVYVSFLSLYNPKFLSIRSEKVIKDRKKNFVILKNATTMIYWYRDLNVVYRYDFVQIIVALSKLEVYTYNMSNQVVRATC